MQSLMDAPLGEEQIVIDITAEAVLRDRLLEMGLAPGRTVKKIFLMPFDGPVVVQSGLLTLALRQEEANAIWVE